MSNSVFFIQSSHNERLNDIKKNSKHKHISIGLRCIGCEILTDILPNHLIVSVNYQA